MKYKARYMPYDQDEVGEEYAYDTYEEAEQKYLELIDTQRYGVYQLEECYHDEPMPKACKILAQTSIKEV